MNFTMKEAKRVRNITIGLMALLCIGIFLNFSAYLKKDKVSLGQTVEEQTIPVSENHLFEKLQKEIEEMRSWWHFPYYDGVVFVNSDGTPVDLEEKLRFYGEAVSDVQFTRSSDCISFTLKKGDTISGWKTYCTREQHEKYKEERQ